MNLKCLLLAIATCATLLASPFAPACAQSKPPKVLDEKQVTEKDLIDALQPSAEEVEGMRTRTLRVGPGTAAGAPATGAAAVAPATAAGAATAGAVAAAPRRDVHLLVTFVTNSTALTQRAQSALDVVAAALKSQQLAGVRFTIEGHADPRGNHAANLALSQGRAEAVRNYLIAAHGIGGDRLVAVGKGDTEPLDKAFPAAPENRRVTLVTRLE